MSGTRRNSYQIQALLDKAKERETYKKNHKINQPKAYTKRANFSTVYYHDFSKNRVLQMLASDAGLKKLGDTVEGGAKIAGLLLIPPTGIIPVPTRGLNYPVVKIHWFFGDDNPEAKVTAWGTRYIKYYDKDGGQSHYSLPFSVLPPTAGTAIAPVTLDELIAKLNGLFERDKGTKKALLGTRGIARLAIGRETISVTNI